MASTTSGNFYNRPVVKWIEHRLPIFSFVDHSLGSQYPTPRNLSYWWNFGSLAGAMLVIMILSGVFLAMNYTPHVSMAFDSVERIMRDVNWGWLLRYIHMNGASFFFIVVYIHIFRGFYYGSYKAPREILWWLGVLILLLMMATAFMGYVLPWGQMSFWGATVITNLFSAFPLIGDWIVTLLWGGFAVDNPTLNRFFSLHYLLPFVIAGVVVLHIWALHMHGSNNPLGIDTKGPQDKIPFHPYYTVKDAFGLAVFFVIFAGVVFFAPNFFGEPDNYIPANPLQTPPHIVPEWYFLPFYAILRSTPDNFIGNWMGFTLVPAKLAGVLLMFGAILVLFVLPWLDTSRVRSARFRPTYRVFFWIFLIDCIGLGIAGKNPPDGWYLILGRVATAWYFIHFILVLPLLGWFERPLPLPTSISEAVLSAGKKAAAAIVVALGLTAAMASPSLAADEHHDAAPLASPGWSFSGPLGLYDPAARQRGFQIYKEVCAACHAMKLIHYRNLAEIGFSEDEVKALAASVEVTDGPNDQGEMFQRAGRASDPFKSPFANELAARASNNGAYPPDLSLITKARASGPDYVYSLLTGYGATPAGVHVAEGMNYNKYFPGNQIAMPQPLDADRVTYSDGTKATLEQEAKDVVTFLAWAAEPEMEVRKRLGVKVLIFLVLLSALLFAVKRKVWANVH